MRVVELDIAYFRAAYPAFADAETAPDAMLERLWSEAEILVDNTAASSIPARDPSGNPRAAILYALLCHLATLETRGDVVGRVGGAAQGSVNMSVAADAMRSHGLGAFARLGRRAAVLPGVLTWRTLLISSLSRC